MTRARTTPPNDGLNTGDIVFADYGSVNPAHTRILRYFEAAHLAPPMREVAESFQSLAWRLADVQASDQQEMERALDLLLQAKDRAVRAVLPTVPLRAEHQGTES